MGEEFERIRKRIEELERMMRDYVEESFRRELEGFKEELRRAFESFRPSWSSEGYLRPLYTVRDAGTYYVIMVDLPRADESKIDVGFSGNSVLIKAKMKKAAEFKGWSSRGSEVSFTEYREVITLPTPVKPEEAEVKVRKGVLVIKVPKKLT